MPVAPILLDLLRVTLETFKPEIETALRRVLQRRPRVGKKRSTKRSLELHEASRLGQPESPTSTAGRAFPETMLLTPRRWPRERYTPKTQKSAKPPAGTQVR